MSKIKQSNFKESRLKDFEELFYHDSPNSVALVMVDDHCQRSVGKEVKQFLSETIDMAEKRIIKLVEDEVIGKDETEFGYDGEEIVDDKEVSARNNLRWKQRDKLKSLSPKE